MLPLLYHTHHSAHTEDLPFWLELAAQNSSPILELGCGTGRVTIPLLQNGFDVVGLDRDPEMLICLQNNMQSTAPRQPQLRLVQGDMTSFALQERFALILLPCNTFSTLQSGERQNTLACVARHLLPGGIFAVSLPNPTLFYDLPARSAAQLEETFIHPQTKNIVQVFSGWRRNKTQFIVTWRYDHLLPDGSTERFTTEVRHELDSAELYVREIAGAGLEIQAIYGDFEKNTYEPDADEMIIVAQKPHEDNLKD